MSSLRHLCFASLLFATLLAARAPLPAGAKEIEVPIRLDHELVRQTLLAQIYTADDQRAQLWDDGTGCGFLTLWDPKVDSVGGRLRITSHGQAQVGTPFGESCLAPVQWKGLLEIFEEPVLSDDRQVLHLRVVESNLFDVNRRKGLFTGKIWDLVKRFVQPRFDTVRFDLHRAMQDLRELLPLVVHNGDTEPIEAMLASVRLSESRVTQEGLGVGLQFSVAPRPGLMPPTAEPTLTPFEIERWQSAWQRWDGFLTFVVKIFGKEIPAPEVQFTLRDILLESRFDILEALAPQPGIPDPTRALFLKTWERLAPVVRASAGQLPGTAGLRYLSFIAAGDALAALDQAGPDIGLDISADGLRRLARVLDPYTVDDPVEYATAVDPELRRLFGFAATMPEPDLSAMPTDEALDGALPSEEDTPEPEESPSPPPAVTPPPSPQPEEPISAWLERLRTLALRTAYAAEAPPATAALERWVAERDNIEPYLLAVRTVLTEATKAVLEAEKLDPAYHDVYRKLVFATAWKESCWRQFLRSRGRITYMKSSVGAAGMMQVYEKVWRGIYDVQGLRWDIRYNSRAGAEILLHYLRDYAVAKKEHQQAGGIDNLARSTYAVYNGGPGHRSRYRQSKTKPGLRAIDDAFYEKYRTVSAGRELDVRSCYGG